MDAEKKFKRGDFVKHTYFYTTRRCGIVKEYRGENWVEVDWFIPGFESPTSDRLVLVWDCPQSFREENLEHRGPFRILDNRDYLASLPKRLQEANRVIHKMLDAPIHDDPAWKHV